jgi:hypothetical protein
MLNSMLALTAGDGHFRDYLESDRSVCSLIGYNIMDEVTHISYMNTAFR